MKRQTAFLLSVLCLPWAVVAGPFFDVIDISLDLPENSGSQTVDLRDDGTVSGMLLGSGSRWKPVVWRSNGAVEVFDLGFYEEYFVRAGNAAGVMVGQLPGTALGWARSGDVLACIPTVLGCGANGLYLASIGNDINEAGVFVGQHAVAVPGGGFRFEAYRGRANANGGFILQGLGLFHGEFNTSAQAVDNLGRIVGFATIDAAVAEQLALLWMDGVVFALGPPGRNRRPTAISDSGHVVGTERAAGGGFGGFFGLRWHADQPEHPGDILPSLPGAISSTPQDVNSDGSIVGTAFLDDSSLGGRGWLLEDGTLYDLNALMESESPWLILSANAINSRGDIAATARFNALPGTRAVVLRRQLEADIFACGFAK